MPLASEALYAQENACSGRAEKKTPNIHEQRPRSAHLLQIEPTEDAWDIDTMVEGSTWCGSGWSGSPVVPGFCTDCLCHTMVVSKHIRYQIELRRPCRDEHPHFRALANETSPPPDLTPQQSFR